MAAPFLFYPAFFLDKGQAVCKNEMEVCIICSAGYPLNKEAGVSPAQLPLL